MKRLTFLLIPFCLASMVGCAHKEPEVNHLNPPALPKPNGYSHVGAVTGGRTLYISGQIALDRNGALVGAGDLRAQTRQVFENLKVALQASGARLENVVKLTVFMTDVSGLPAFREVRDVYFTQKPPASSLVQVSRLVRPDLLIEIEAVAVVESGT